MRKSWTNCDQTNNVYADFKQYELIQFFIFILDCIKWKYNHYIMISVEKKKGYENIVSAKI